MCPPASAAPANETAAKAAMSLILFMAWFLSSFGVMCFVKSKLRSVRRRARQGAMLRSRTSPPCGVWCCGGSRGGDCHGDASAHDASHGAEAEARDAQPRVWAQDASARDAPPWVPFHVLSPPAAYAWSEQEPLPCAQQAREPLPLAASVPVPSSPSEPCPSAEGSPSELGTRSARLSPRSLWVARPSLRSAGTPSPCHSALA